MGDTGQAMSTTSTTKTSGPKTGANGPGVMVNKQLANTEYEQSLKIVLGTVCGVIGLFGLILIFSLLYKLYKKRNSPRRHTDHTEEELSSSVSIDLEHKQIPTVLLLYAYDCAAHEKVVSALAGFLIDTCNCNVHLDIFEDQIIHERGLDDWLIDRLQEADFIIVLCSVGARLRCTKKRVRFKSDPYRSIPDYFAVAVDYVAEKMRVERVKGLPMSRFIVTYMDYSYSSDIPHQIEMATKFCLMKDITKLFCHVHGFNHSDNNKFGTIYPAVTDKYYENSEMGLELQVAIESAKEFFKCNPNWVEDSMELLPPPKSKCRLVRKSSLEPLLGESSVDHRVVDTTVDVHRQNLSPQPNEQISTSPKISSKSTDSFKIKNRYSADIETIPCIICGQVEHYNDNYSCKGRELRKNNSDNDEDDGEFSPRIKSKSLPTVCSTSFHGSQTVFHVDVHKEWAANDGRISDADSQEYGSSKDLDDLEKDLQSIIMPISNKSNHALTHIFFGSPKSMSLPPMSCQMHVLPKLSYLPASKHSSSSSMGSQDDQVVQDMAL